MPRTVLVIDDEHSVRTATELLLASWGWSTLGAASGREAVLAIARSARDPDVIVSDYRLAGSERGDGAIARVRERCGWEMPALLVTADRLSGMPRELEASALFVLRKPTDPVRLRAALERCIAVSGSMTAGRAGRQAEGR